jgi:hypothetical protein
MDPCKKKKPLQAIARLFQKSHKKAKSDLQPLQQSPTSKDQTTGKKNP